MAEHWSRLRREAAQEAAAARAVSGSVLSRVDPQSSALRSRILEATETYLTRGSGQHNDPTATDPLLALGRHLDSLIRQHGQHVDVNELVELRNPAAALGTVLRNKPPYLQSCTSGGAIRGLAHMETFTTENTSSGSLTSAVKIIRPTSPEQNEAVPLLGRPDAPADVPNSVPPASPALPLRRARKAAQQAAVKRMDKENQTEVLQEWTISILRARFSVRAEELPAGVPLLAAVWHLSKSHKEAWRAVLKAAGSKEPEPPAPLPFLLSIANIQQQQQQRRRQLQHHHQQSLSSEASQGSEATGSPLMRRLTRRSSSGGGSSSRWWWPNKVAPSSAGGSGDGGGGDRIVSARPSRETLRDEAAASRVEAELIEAAKDAEIHAGEWGILSRSLPVALPTAELHALALKPAAALARCALGALAMLPPMHPAAASLAPQVDGLHTTLANALKIEWGNSGALSMYSRLLESLQRAAVAEALLREATALAPALEANIIAGVAERVGALVKSCEDGGRMLQIPDIIWSSSSTPQPQRMAAPVVEAFQILVEACNWVGSSVPACALLPAMAGILRAMNNAAEQLEALIWSSANGSTTRAHRLGLVSAAECLLHIYRCSVLESLQAITDRDPGTAVYLNTDPALQLHAVAVGVEARLHEARRSSVSAAKAAELQLILGVTLGDVNSTPWESFRAPLVLKASAGPGVRVWATQLWSLLEEGADILSAPELASVFSTVLVRSLIALQRRYDALSPSTMGWRDRFCGDAALMCSTAFSLCHHVPLSVAPGSNGTDGPLFLGEYRNPLISAAAWTEASSICRRIAAMAGLQSCPADILASRLTASDDQGKSCSKQPWSWLPESHVLRLLDLARKEHTTEEALASTLTSEGGEKALEAALWHEASAAAAAACAGWEARAALPLRGELHDEIRGLEYSQEHLEAREILQAATRSSTQVSDGPV